MGKNGKVKEIGTATNIPKRRRRLSMDVAISLGIIDPSELFDQGVRLPHNWSKLILKNINHSKNGTSSPKYFIRLLIENRINLIINISEGIDDIMDNHPKMRDAKIPEVRSFPTMMEMSWCDFRKTRWEQIKKSILSSSLEEFPLAGFDFHNAGGFKILKDDCTDIWNVLRNIEILTPALVQCLFFTVDDIMNRYYYMSGFFKLKYKLSSAGKKGGEKEKKSQPILLAAIKYLQDKPNLRNKPNNYIVESFKRNVANEDNCITVVSSDCEWDVFFYDECIWAKPLEDKEHKEESVKVGTFRKTYLQNAKEELIKEIKK